MTSNALSGYWITAYYTVTILEVNNILIYICKKLKKPTQILPLQQSNDTKNLGIIAIQAKKQRKLLKNTAKMA